MSSLLTSTIDQAPQVLLISDHHPLLAEVRAFFQQQTVEVCELTPEELLKVGQQSSFVNREFYQIVVLTSPATTEENQATLVNFLRTRTEKKLVLAWVADGLKNGPIADRHWITQTNDQQRFLDQLNSLPQLFIFAGVNVCSPELNDYYPWRFFIQEIKKRQLILQPDVNMSLQTPANYWQVIKSEIFKPEPQNLMVSGQIWSSSEIIALIQTEIKKYYQQDLEIKELKVSPQWLEFSQLYSWIKVTQAQRLNLIVDPTIRLIYQLKSLKDSLFDHYRVKPILTTEVKASPQLITQEKVLPMIKRNDLAVRSVANQSIAGQPAPTSQLTAHQTSSAPSQSATTNTKDANQSIFSHEDEINRLFKMQQVEKKVTRRVAKADVVGQIKKKATRKKTAFWIGLVVIVVGSLSLLAGFTLWSQTRLNHRRLLITASQIVEQQKIIATFEPLKIWQQQAQLAQRLGVIELAQPAQKLNQVALSLNEVAATEDKWQQQNQQLFNRLTKGTSALEVVENLATQKQLTESLYNQISLLAADLSSFDSDLNPTDRKIIADLSTYLTKLRKKIAKLQEFQPVLNWLLAEDSQRTLAVIWQDNQELRPTGGFIQAVLLLKINQGELIDAQIFNIYQLDAKLLGKKTAPAEINSLLGETNYNLRDANWQPDFRHSAADIIWFLKESLNQEIDGVVAVNYSTVADWLENWQGLALPDYSEQITAKNIWERLRYHATETGVTTGDKNVHTVLLQTVWDKIKQLDGPASQDLMSNWYQSLEAKQSLIYLTKEANQQILDNLDWSGQIVNPTCPAEFSLGECVVDTFYQVEANVGVNQVNPLVTQNINHLVKIEADRVTHQRIIKLHNTATSSVWPLGTLKDYWRFYLPISATGVKIFVDGQQLETNNLITYLASNRQVYALLATINSQSQVEITIKYQVPLIINSGDAYLFFSQQQPGVLNKEENISLQYPVEYYPQLVAPQADMVGELLNFKTNDQGHQLVGVKF